MTTPLPTRAFLSMIARSMTQFLPMPIPGDSDLLREGGLVEIRAHDDAVADRRAGVDVGAHADDRALDLGVGHDAAIGNDGLLDGGAVDLARGQETRVRVDRRGRIEEIEGRQRVGEIEIGLEKGADRPDVLPIALENIGLHAALVDHLGDDVLAEIDVLIVERIDEGLRG